MTSSLTDFAAGHVFPPIQIHVDADRVLAYCRATGDGLPLYADQKVAPPLAVAAFALGALLESVGLPPGTLHVNEALEFLAPVALNANVECSASLVQRSQRGGWIVSVLESQIKLDGALVIRARASVLSPAAGE